MTKKTIKINPYLSGLLEIGMALVFRELQLPRQSEDLGEALVFQMQRNMASELCVLLSGGGHTLTVRDPLDLGLLLSSVEAVLDVLPYTQGYDELKKLRASLLGIDDG